MNNFDTPAKIASVDSTIESILDKNHASWKSEELHSWAYTSGDTNLGAIAVYGSKDYKFQSIALPKAPDNIATKFTKVEDVPMKSAFNFVKSLFVPLKDNDYIHNKFILELSMVLFTGVSPYNIVISNIHPEPKAIGDSELYSAVGKWYTGLK